eukprot:313937-Pelagomonas_calceolata.AAC.1
MYLNDAGAWGSHRAAVPICAPVLFCNSPCGTSLCPGHVKPRKKDSLCAKQSVLDEHTCTPWLLCPMSG